MTTSYSALMDEVKRFSAAHPFLTQLKHYQRRITPKQFSALRRKAIDGMVVEAEEELYDLVGRTHNVDGVRC